MILILDGKSDIGAHVKLSKIGNILNFDYFSHHHLLSFLKLTGQGLRTLIMVVPVIWLSIYLVIRPFDYPVIRLSGYPAVRLSGFLAIMRLFGYLFILDVLYLG